jgi:uncharacterized protein YjiS (DUF1127 family)
MSGQIEIDPIARDEIRGRSPISLSRQTETSDAARVNAEYIVQSEASRIASPDWSATIASLLVKFRSRVRRGLDLRLAMMELQTVDDRTMRAIGISRCDIERVTRRGDRCA